MIRKKRTTKPTSQFLSIRTLKKKLEKQNSNTYSWTLLHLHACKYPGFQSFTFDALCHAVWVPERLETHGKERDGQVLLDENDSSFVSSIAQILNCFPHLEKHGTIHDHPCRMGFHEVAQAFTHLKKVLSCHHKLANSRHEYSTQI